MIRTGSLFDGARAAASAAALNGCRLTITDAHGNDLATIPTTAWSAQDARSLMEPTSPVTVDRSGEAAAFRCESGDQVLIAGDIPEDMELDRRDLVKGGTFKVDAFAITS